LNTDRHIFSRGFSLVTTIYVLALAVYLILRIVVRDGWWWLAFFNNFAPYYFAPLLILLPLALIARSRFSIARLLPFVVIFLLWYGPYWLPKSTVVAFESESLKIVTFNVQPFNRRLDEVISWLREMNADIVLLQETPPDALPLLRDSLRDTYPYNDNLYGNQLTLSRHEIISAEIIDVAYRRVRRITFEIDGQSLAVYNIHLPVAVRTTPHFYTPIDNGFLHLFLKYDETRRNAQIRALLEHLQAESLPYIVAGDFNTSDNAVIYSEIADTMYDSFREVGIGLGASWPAETGEEGLPDFLPALVRIDYVWHSEEFYAVSAAAGPRLGSDHLPLIVSLGTKAS
jgi:endonuclease/exonuclease/phosphatase (EEP) superfamily protein YafD